MPPRAPVDFVVGCTLRALFLGDQRLAVGDRDLIIVGMDFAECQKSMAIAAVIDEGGLQRRLNARHFRQIDIAPKLLALRGFKVEFFDAIAAQNDHPGLLGMGRVDEHFVRHWQISRGRHACSLRVAVSGVDWRGKGTGPIVGEWDGLEVPRSRRGPRAGERVKATAPR